MKNGVSYMQLPSVTILSTKATFQYAFWMQQLTFKLKLSKTFPKQHTKCHSIHDYKGFICKILAVFNT